MSVTIKKIEQVCDELRITPGMESEIALVNICGVVSIPNTSGYVEATPDLSHTLSGDIVLKDGYHFVKWNGRRKDASYKASTEGDEDAKTVKVEMPFYIPRIEEFKTYIMSQAINAKFLVLFKDRNIDKWRLVGEKGNGAEINPTEQTNPKSGYVLNITCSELPDFPPFYTGAVPEEPVV